MASGRSAHENSAAATLWAHLSRKDTLGRATATLDSASFVPPSGPQDKTATTMRVLLHDTQMNLEKFSGNAERLSQDVQSAAQNIKQTSSTFEQEHDKLMGGIIDLANRVQSKILTSIGTPAQSQVVTDLFKDVDRRLESLDQRLTAIQTFNQTHSQALQTQMTAIQGLQTQHTVIVAAVTPLLPLLQSIQSSFACTHGSTASLPPAVPVISVSSKPPPKPPSSVITISSEGSPKSVRKRSRSISASHASSSPLANGVARKKHRDGPSTNPSGSAVASSSSTAARSPKQRISLRLQTPRRPLQEIFLQSPRFAFTPGQAQHPKVPRTDEQAGPSAKKSKKNSSPSTESRLDRIVRQMSVQQSTSSCGNQSASLSLSTPMGQVTSTPQTTRIRTKHLAGSLQRPPPRALDTGTRPAAGLALPSLPRRPTLGSATSHQLINAAVPLATIEGMPAPSFIPTRNKDSASLKEGKRFIPLVDTDEEDDE